MLLGCLCSHGECVPLRKAARAGPSDDGWLCEPDHNDMTQAYFDATYAGDGARAGDWADIASDERAHSASARAELLRRAARAQLHAVLVLVVRALARAKLLVVAPGSGHKPPCLCVCCVKSRPLF